MSGVHRRGGNCSFCFPSTQADEPVKPTAPATETNPAVPRRPFVARRSVQRRPRRPHTSYPGMGKVHSRSPRRSPRRRISSIKASHSFIRFTTSNQSGLSAKRLGSTLAAPWRTGAWRCRTSIIPRRAQGSSRRPAEARYGGITPANHSIWQRSSHSSRTAPTLGPSGRPGFKGWSRRPGFPGDIDAAPGSPW